MFGPALDVAIGVIFFYLMFSLMVSALNEFIAWLFSLRSKTLRRGIGQLLNDKATLSVWRWAKTWLRLDAVEMHAKPWENLAAKIYHHPLIQGLSQDDKLPSYIPSATFATALIDVLQQCAVENNVAPAASENLSEEQVALLAAKAAITQLPANLKTALNAVLDESITTLDAAKVKLARWFDDSMERVSGWYKRYMQAVVFVSGAIVAVGLNGDTIAVAKALNTDPALRASVYQTAAAWVKSHPPDPAQKEPDACKDWTAAALAARAKNPSAELPAPDLQCAAARFEVANQALSATKLPVGWTRARLNALKVGYEWLFKLLGLLITVFALSQGAPFWFDLLNRVVNIRSSGPAPTPTKNT